MYRRVVRRLGSRGVRAFALACCLLAVAAGPALAHGGTLRGNQQELAIPTWLFLSTGGGAVGASFLLASFATDRAFVRSVHRARDALSLPARDLLVAATRLVGVVGLLAVLVVGWVGPVDPLQNLAVLVVWGGWWAGFAMTTYLVGDAWPVLNPWRTVGRYLPSLGYDYPERLGAWPSVVGLLLLIWVEVVSPLADDPRLLTVVVAAYTVVTLGGVLVVGEGVWFRRVDPVSRVFAYYGRVAPVSRTESGLELRLPGSALTESRLAVDSSEVGFVVALVWVTTYDGFVATPVWRTLVTPLVEAGLPPALLYPLALVVGYVLFLGAFRLAARKGREYAESYLAAGEIARRFAPSLLAIAAGYHLAHYLGYFLSLLPMLVGALLSPFSPPPPEYLVLPAWVGGLELLFVLVGHLLAIWVAHATAYALFPGRMQAIRSQYPLTAVMILYTMTSLLIVSQPAIDPPYL
ncbi:hypothetical protein [Halomarina litorea]|uniref:hypothetical protein n=1 Tax=Halomarina litorea TaxID=2961595 RepID=UPI0020C3B1D7|nr:hypothetical protein [Halomarina sp. BCD28]